VCSSDLGNAEYLLAFPGWFMGFPGFVFFGEYDVVIGLK
jgi:hypothetical protein